MHEANGKQRQQLTNTKVSKVRKCFQSDVALHARSVRIHSHFFWE